MSAGVEIWLIRHGETEWSLSGAHTSTTDIALTEHGRQRAVELVEPGLMEWNYGESEGKTTAEMRKIHGPDWSVWSSPIVGGETVEHVGERADGVIAKALGVVAGQEAGPSASPQDDKFKGQDEKPKGSQAVALFAHAHILRILAARWIGLPAVGGRLFALGTGSVSVLGFERETRVVAKWNRGFEEGKE
jgi:broad specificity phosphatase PhoE